MKLVIRDFIKAWGFAGETPTALLPDNSTNLVAIGFETEEIKAKLIEIRESQGLEPIVIWKYNGFTTDKGTFPLYVLAIGHSKSLTVSEILILDELLLEDRPGIKQAMLDAKRRMHHYIIDTLGYRVILK